jgi:hypothetical protein
VAAVVVSYSLKYLYKVNFGLIEFTDGIYSIKYDRFFSNKNNYHYGLFPVIFRYLSFFDPNISTCFIGDIDNLCTRLLAEHLKNFDKSNNQFLIIRPGASYDRPYFGKKCMNNFLAGMMGFKKNIGEILNIEIFQSFYILMDKNILFLL